MVRVAGHCIKCEKGCGALLDVREGTTSNICFKNSLSTPGSILPTQTSVFLSI